MSMGGGGGGGGPSQSTQYSTNIPEYARPYVENMLGATQAQLFNTQQVGGTAPTYDEQGNQISAGTPGTTQISGFKPYQPYSQNVNDYFAGPSPMQQQSYQGMANMQVAPQLAQGSQLATTAGLGSIGLGTQAAGAGQNYYNMATNPAAVQAFMNPYIEQSLAPQLKLLNQQQALAGQDIAAKAVGQGAFGGNRATLAQGLNAQNYDLARQQAIGQGYNQAFNQAQQAQQFGANLGLQGLGVGLQGYGQALGAGTALGQLGQTQYGQQMGILEGQNRFGQQQQQMEQQKINQAISDYATAQQYPMLQLGLMSNMLRGLPMQSQTTQMYQAAPSYMQQGIGAIGSLASLYGAGKKEGGVVGYKYGGAISTQKLEGMADKLDLPQIVQRLKDPQLDKGERQVFEDALQEKAREKARYAGIAAAGDNAFNTQKLAGGGILAFADEGLVDLEKALAKKEESEKPSLYKPFLGSFTENLERLTPAKKYTAAELEEKARGQGVFPEGSPALPTETVAAQDVVPAKTKVDTSAAAAPTGTKASSSAGAPAAKGTTLADMVAERKALGPQGEAGEDFMKFLEDRLGKSTERLGRADKLAMAKAFADFGSKWSPGGIGASASRSLGVYADEYGKAINAEDTITMESQKLRKDLDIARRAEERGDVEGAQKAYDSAADRQNRIQTAQIQAAATMAGHGATQRQQDIAIDKIMKEKGVGYTEALQIYKRAGLNIENTDIARAKAALTEINNQLMFMKKDDPARAALIRQRDQLTQSLVSGGSQAAPQVGTNPDAGGIVDVPGKGKFQQLPNGNYIKIG